MLGIIPSKGWLRIFAKRQKIMEQDWKDRLGVVYSTNSKFEYENSAENLEETLSPEDQLLYVSIDRKKRKGKEVTLVEGFVGTEQDLKELAKTLKQKCGVGGSAKDGEIIVQGNFKDKIATLLAELRYNIKKKGGQ